MSKIKDLILYIARVAALPTVSVLDVAVYISVVSFFKPDFFTAATVALVWFCISTQVGILLNKKFPLEK